jgi:ABC-type Na+ efflux pump permease subunit
MTFLPIVTRELRVASRRRGTYWSRCLIAALAIGGGFLVYLANDGQAPHEIGQALFYVVAGGAFIYCLFAGVRSTADCISEEKREGTLGLLFLTDLKGYDVVGGKLVATSLNAFYGLLSILPVLAIPLLMGGVTNGEFWRMALVLANTFFFSLATGMFMSAISKSPRAGMAATFLFLLAATLGLPLLVATFPFLDESRNLSHVFQLLNPVCSGICVPDLVFQARSGDFWWSAGIIHTGAWLFLALASVIVPRSWQDHSPGAGAGRWRERWRRWNFGNDIERAEFRRRLLGVNPFFWLAGRARLKPVWVWSALAFLACLWTWGALDNGHSWNDAGVFIPTAIILNCLLKLWIASEAGNRLGQDRKIGALELLLSTPLGVRDIIRGQLLALRRQFLGPTLVVMLVEFIFLLASLKNVGSNAGDVPALVAWWAGVNVMLVADMIALSVVAMWVGLSTRNPNRTTSIVVIRVLALPLLVSAVILIFTGVFVSASNIPFNPDWKFFLALWLLPGAFADAFFGLRAWRGLREDFREVAAQRFAPRPTLWQRLFGPGAAAAPRSGV